MQTRIEPPVLMSRLLTFVFAASLVMLVVLVVTLVKMFPLTRPQVFFLTTRNTSDKEIILQSMSPNQSNMDPYMRAFIREYIKARNEIIPNATVMHRKWTRDETGVVRSWSSDDVFAQFSQLPMWNAIMNDVPTFDFECPVEIHVGGIQAKDLDSQHNEYTYGVKFTWYCRAVNNDGHDTVEGSTMHHNYDVNVTLEMDTGRGIKLAQRVNNPLGIRVSRYEITNGDDDPLSGEQIRRETEGN